MASHSFKMLKWPGYLSASAAAIVTNPASKKTQIHNIILHNTDSVNITVKLYLVQNSGGSVGTAGAGNQIAQLIIPANDTAVWEFTGSDALVLNATNDTLQALATVANRVTIAVKGDEITG